MCMWVGAVRGACAGAGAGAREREGEGRIIESRGRGRRGERGRGTEAERGRSRGRDEESAGNNVGSYVHGVDWAARRRLGGDAGRTEQRAAG